MTEAEPVGILGEPAGAGRGEQLGERARIGGQVGRCQGQGREERGHDRQR